MKIIVTSYFIYLFIYVYNLFDDPANSTDYIAKKDKMIID